MFGSNTCFASVRGHSKQVNIKGRMTIRIENVVIGAKVPNNEWLLEARRAEFQQHLMLVAMAWLTLVTCNIKV